MNCYNFDSPLDYRAIESTDMNIFPVNEGFIKGTMFQTLYQPYKNYQPKRIVPKTEKGKILLEIQANAAAMHDMTLYLDLFPNDENAIRLRKQYTENYKTCKKLYESKFPPFRLESESINKAPWSWSTTKWPWEGEE